jgi:hypothetical protein
MKKEKGTFRFFWRVAAHLEAHKKPECPLFVLVLLAFVAAGCAKKQPPPAPAPSEPVTPVHFVNVAKEAGLEAFRHGGSADASILSQPIPREAVTPEFVRAKIAGFLGSGVGFADYDDDGYPDLYFVNCGADDASSRSALFHNNGNGTFTDVTDNAGMGHVGQGMAVTWGDYDNDGFVDLYVACNGPNVLYRNNGKGTFTDVTELAGVQDDRFTIAATFVDYDHDGDLDLYLVNYIDPTKLPDKPQLRFPDDFPGVENVLLQNDGSGHFKNVTEQTKISDGARRGSAGVFADLTVKNAVGLFLVNDRQPWQAFISTWNGVTWDGTYREQAVGPDPAPSAQGLVLADVDNNGYPDAYVATGPGEPDVLLLNYGGGKFLPYQATPGLLDATVSRMSTGAAVFDYDNDGGWDIISAGEDVTGSGAGTMLLFANNKDGNVVFNKPPTFRNVSQEAGLAELGSPRCRGLSVADYDRDGDLDVCVQVNGGSPLLLRNEGGNRNHWLDLRLEGVRERDNRSAIGTKVNVTAGGVRFGELVGANGYQSANPPGVLHFGLGQETTAHLYVKWPQGYVEEFDKVQGDRPFAVSETTAGKLSSCPMLFAWDGEKYRFVSDTLGSVLLGAIQADGSTVSLLDTDEYVKIPGEQLQPKDGYWSVIFSDQLRETAYLDRGHLLIVDHPADVLFYCNERLSSAPPYPEFRLFTARGERLPISAVREDGTDILPALSKIDRVYAPHGKPLNYEGIVEPHSYILDLGDLSGYGHAVLVLFGWSDFSTVDARYAAGQAGVSVLPVTLSVKDASGEWVTAIEDIGEPGGWPKPETVDLKGLFKTNDYHVRITSNIALYYDRATVMDYAPDLPLRVFPMEADRAELVHGGFAQMSRPDGRKPDVFLHEQKLPYSPWGMFCYGKHTRYGDIRELLVATDDIYAIMAPGDEAVIDFATSRAPELPQGWVRDFVFYADGFMKDIRYRIAYGSYVEPLPFHKMSAYPPVTGESYPMDEQHRRYIEAYNTRDITPATASGAGFPPVGFGQEGGATEPGK